MNDIEKVKTVIDFIESHLTSKLDLDQISESVHYSKYYLHRMFSKTVGLTIHEYLQRRQLTEAAKLLVFSRKPILDIALLAGYESQQAFTTAFKNMYKQSPDQFRENEVFYPLQLKLELDRDLPVTDPWNGDITAHISLAEENDIPCWMELARLVIDGFPYLDENEHMQTLKECIRRKEAFILKNGNFAVGTMIFSYATGNIGFLAVHPLYRQQGIAKAFLDKVMNEVSVEKGVISITTYRENDKADTGHRELLKKLGFAEAELLVEYGYPTQKFTLINKGLEEV